MFAENWKRFFGQCSTPFPLQSHRPMTRSRALWHFRGALHHLTSPAVCTLFCICSDCWWFSIIQWHVSMISANNRSVASECVFLDWRISVDVFGSGDLRIEQPQHYEKQQKKVLLNFMKKLISSRTNIWFLFEFHYLNFYSLELFAYIPSLLHTYLCTSATISPNSCTYEMYAYVSPLCSLP